MLEFITDPLTGELSDDDLFIGGVDSNMEESGALYICRDKVELVETLKTLDPRVDDEITLLKGVLTLARTLPAEKMLSGNFNIYIVVTNFVSDDGEYSGLIMESACDGSLDKLAEEVETIVKEGIGDIEGVAIDDIFILYGNEISLRYSADDADVARTSNCKGLVENLRTLVELAAANDV